MAAGVFQTLTNHEMVARRHLIHLNSTSHPHFAASHYRRVSEIYHGSLSCIVRPLIRTVNSLGSMATAKSNAVELSIPLPQSLDTRIYIRLSTQTKAVMISLTTASADEGGSAKPMGSFVYAMPDVRGLKSTAMRLHETNPAIRDSTRSSPLRQHFSPPSPPWSSLLDMPNLWPAGQNCRLTSPIP